MAVKIIVIVQNGIKNNKKVEWAQAFFKLKMFMAVEAERTILATFRYRITNIFPG